MLLIIEALLILAALGQDHRAAVALNLDMALNSVDDYYYGCRDEMAEKVKEYLQKERGNSEFNNAWGEGEKNAFNAPRDALKHNNSIAIYVYTNTEKYNIYPKFNNDTRNGKQNYTNGTYQWYSLQFLLTEAIQILRKKQNECFNNTSRGTKLAFTGSTSSIIRFGSFTSSSLDRNLAKRFGSKSCFNISTCLGANVTKYSRLPYEKEVLIPPYEMFTVTDVKTRTVQKDLWCETVFTLKSFGTRSDLNCTLFKKPTKTIAKYYTVR